MKYQQINHLFADVSIVPKCPNINHKRILENITC
jgi:hypothetical protein